MDLALQTIGDENIMFSIYCTSCEYHLSYFANHVNAKKHKHHNEAAFKRSGIIWSYSKSGQTLPKEI